MYTKKVALRCSQKSHIFEIFLLYILTFVGSHILSIFSRFAHNFVEKSICYAYSYTYILFLYYFYIKNIVNFIIFIYNQLSIINYSYKHILSIYKHVHNHIINIYNGGCD
jgi:hypothetical protein